jgi:adenylate cyclase
MRRLFVAALLGGLAAVLVPSVLRDRAQDVLTPRTAQVDDRLAVVDFADETAVVGGLQLFSDGYHRGTYVRDVVVQAERAGARAVLLVGFDSQSLTGGQSDRADLAASRAFQSAAVIPLQEFDLRSYTGQLPLAVHYRVDVLANEAAGIGAPLPLSVEGVLRTVPEVVRVQALIPQTLVEVQPAAEAAAAKDATTTVGGLSLRGAIALTADTNPDLGPAGAELFGHRVALEDGNLRVRWSSGLDDSNDQSVIRAVNLLAPDFDPTVFKGRVVLVGTSDPAVAPTYDTPAGRLSELMVHANALNTLLLDNSPVPEPNLPAIGLAALAALGIAGLWRWRPLVATLAGIAVVLGWLQGARVLAGTGKLVDPLAGPVAVTVTLLVLAAAHVALAIRQRRRLSRLFEEYVPPEVARKLIVSGRAGTAEAGERLVVTVQFCDLRGFTPLSAKLTPSQVRALLVTYYEALSQIVFAHGGTILQYTGDEIFAAFGAPVPRSDHADAALACARDMIGHRDALNQRLADEDLPPLSYGIGLNSGEIIAANVGSSIRMQYSIIGDAVNVGSRYCTLAREEEIALSQHTFSALSASPDDAADLGLVPMKGVSDPVRSYLIRCEPPASTTASGRPVTERDDGGPRGPAPRRGPAPA